jgi:hypothetical protein
MNGEFYHARIKKGKQDNCWPHSAAVIAFLLALSCHYCVFPLLLCKCSFPSTAAMGKRGSTAAATTVAAKKAKTSAKATDADASAVGN